MLAFLTDLLARATRPIEEVENDRMAGICVKRERIARETAKVLIIMWVENQAASSEGEKRLKRNRAQPSPRPLGQRKQVTNTYGRKTTDVNLIHIKDIRGLSSESSRAAGLQFKLDGVAELALPAELAELLESGSEVVEEDILAGGVLLNEGLEAGILDEDQVSGKHHEGTRGVLELLGVGLGGPEALRLGQEGEVLVGEGQGASSPGTIEARAVGVATADSVSTREGNDLLVVEAHLGGEDPTEVVASLSGVRETALGGALLTRLSVHTAGTERHLGATHGLDGDDTRQLPEVSIRDLGVLVLDGLEEVAGNGETAS